MVVKAAAWARVRQVESESRSVRQPPSGEKDSHPHRDPGKAVLLALSYPRRTFTIITAWPTPTP